jgi:hypothetical protein
VPKHVGDCASIVFTFQCTQDCFDDLIEVNQQDNTFDGIYLYYATLHVSGICPSSGVYKEITITICVILCIQIMVGGTSSFTNL